MISYEVPCFFCKNEFSVLEGTSQYQQVKRNMKARHCCDDCTKLIEMDAKKSTGLTTELIDALENNSLDERVAKYENAKGKQAYDFDAKWVEAVE